MSDLNDKFVNEYWGKRVAAAQNKLTTKNITQVEKQLTKYYLRTFEKILGQMELTYTHLLSSIDEGREPTPADLYNLDKYWQMQAQVSAELERLGNNQIALLSKRFTAQFMDIYASFALQSEPAFNRIDTAAAQQMIKQIWCADGKTWSERVWTNINKLQETLNAGLIETIVAGKKTADLKNILQERFDVSYAQADSVVRTEMAHIQTQAAKERYEDYGIKEVEVYADKDERRCEQCGELHGERYLIHEVMPIPVHPNCRCCVIPVIE